MNTNYHRNDGSDTEKIYKLCKPLRVFWGGRGLKIMIV